MMDAVLPQTFFGREQAVWVGTRFVAAVEAAAPKLHKDAVIKSGFEDNIRTVIYSAPALRLYHNIPYAEILPIGKQNVKPRFKTFAIVE
ncbi:hypothetical protein MPER_15827 [Moniliophthora perniciosa FA553]|nr:hypothetical protein MPER_15827 [Moniliophthora perniciosa FA553]